MNKFDIWFKAQFGQLPYECRSDEQIGRDLHMAKQSLKDLKCEWDNKKRLEDMYKAALYGRNLKKDEKYLESAE